VGWGNVFTVRVRRGVHGFGEEKGREKKKRKKGNRREKGRKIRGERRRLCTNLGFDLEENLNFKIKIAGRKNNRKGN